jgi:hypothetical protein
VGRNNIAYRKVLQVIDFPVITRITDGLANEGAVPASQPLMN